MSKATYYHGGAPDIQIGGFILPPQETGQPSSASFGASGVCKKNKVYITTSKEAALIYAACHPSNRGCVYVVKPVGDMAHDEDCTLEGLSYEVDYAKVVEKIRMKHKDRLRIRKAILAQQ